MMLWLLSWRGWNKMYCSGKTTDAVKRGFVYGVLLNQELRATNARLRAFVCQMKSKKYKKLYPELFKWLEETFNDNVYLWNKQNEFYFQHEEDAMAFKLIWIRAYELK